MVILPLFATIFEESHKKSHEKIFKHLGQYEILLANNAVGMSILYQAHQDDTLPRGWKGLATWPVLEPMEGEDDRVPQGWIGGREECTTTAEQWG